MMSGAERRTAMDKTEDDGGPLARLAGVWRFLRHAVRCYRRDNGLQVAAALSYSSLLAMVPLAAISLALISALPALDEVRMVAVVCTLPTLESRSSTFLSIL